MVEMSAVWSMMHSIFLCVVVSQNETEERVEAAMNVPLLARAMHRAPQSLLLSIDHRDDPVDTSRQWM